ncbi:hypothetical protein HPB47_004079 [Ixodes persulcatus]|uniref:Uncharacterized protein n=1 Tax=Ixodes persulcatus TaxID=34615 RepID=A0AC60PGM2_IXOPE|nr:hypothetical protein HPB47_004079 [Ixodes persulcatus]
MYQGQPLCVVYAGYHSGYAAHLWVPVEPESASYDVARVASPVHAPYVPVIPLELADLSTPPPSFQFRMPDTTRPPPPLPVAGRRRPGYWTEPRLHHRRSCASANQGRTSTDKRPRDPVRLPESGGLSEFRSRDDRGFEATAGSTVDAAGSRTASWPAPGDCSGRAPYYNRSPAGWTTGDACASASQATWAPFWASPEPEGAYVDRRKLAE